MGQIIEVQLGNNRTFQYFDMHDVSCVREDYVIVEEDRGSDYGRVVSDPRTTCKVKNTQVVGKVLRKATEGDLKQIANNQMKAKDAYNVCLRKINERKLDMQLVGAEYTFDSSKIIFSFVSEERVDFRNLVKDLASVFRVRIELKQIGVRDKAKIVSGFGVCGRELCCSSFLKDFHQLSIKMAKEQGLPLNPSRISGVCGRIKCCMAYEFVVYKEMSRSLPHVGDKIKTTEGQGKVLEVNILKRVALVDLGEGRVIKQSYPKLNEN